MPRPLAAPLIVAALLISSTAAAQPSPKEEAKAPERTVSVTTAPVLLLLPMLEVTGEFKLSESFSVSAVAGYGRTSQDTTILNETTTDTFDVFTLGASARYYVAGTFESGMQLGVAAEYIDIRPGQDVSLSALEINGVTGGLIAAPFVGYKIVANSGFTFDAQFGPSYLVVDTDPQGLKDSEVFEDREDSKWELLINLQLGWSF